jgi:hypothetical protein
MNRILTLPAILSVCSALAVAVGCAESSDPAESDAAPAAAQPAEPVYRTAEELLAYLKTLKTGEDRLAMIDLVHTVTTTEQMTRRFTRSIDEARMEYAHAINETFAPEGEPLMPTDLGMGAFHEALATAVVEQVSPVRVRVKYTTGDGTERAVVLERWGTWKLHISTLRDGEEFSTVWYSMHQGEFAGLLKYHRDVTEQIRAGEFATAGEAQAKLDELLAGPMPPFGSVQP